MNLLPQTRLHTEKNWNEKETIDNICAFDSAIDVISAKNNSDNNNDVCENS